MKNITRYMGTLVVCLVLLSVCIQPTYAAGFGGGERAGEFGSGGFGGTTVKTEISYDALSELCVVVNDQITQGLFEDVSPFCDTSDSLAATVRYDLDNGFYVISVKVGTTYYNLRNNSGGLYVAYENSDSLLAGIWGFLSNIDQALTSENGPFALWMSLLDTDLDLVNINLEQISLKVQSVVDYTNVIANGTTTLVEKMDELIEAVNGISISADGATINFDTLPITDKLDEVITAIEGISVNVEGSTINFDTNPITDKLDEVITAINGISVESAFCNHEYVGSGQYTYKTILPLTHYSFITGADSNGFHEIDFFKLIEGETYQVNYNGEISQHVARVTSTGANGIVYIGNTLSGGVSYDTPYQFSLKYHYTCPPAGEEVVEFTAIDPLSESGDLSVAQRVEISYCSKCGALEGGTDLLTLIGTINNAASAIHHAVRIYSANHEFSVTTDLTEVITTLEENHADVMEGLVVIYEWLSTKSLIAPCEHSYMPVVMVEPSCDFPGVTKFTCEYCDTFRMELSAPLGHEWEGGDSSAVPLLEDVSLSLLDSNVVDGINVNTFGCQEIISLTPGEQYTVVYNGVSYVMECRLVEMDGQSAIVLGNAEFMMGTGDTGDPFILTSGDSFGATVLFSLDGAASAVISVYEGAVEVSTGHSLRVCTRCHVGVNAAALMEFLDERLTSSPGGGSDLTPVLTRLDTIIESLGADLGEAGCEHVYVAEVNQEQTCILPGLQTHTCELCGSSYSEILESLGHDWQCTEHVEDELDPETGEVISSGYDIYTCSICDDTYNDYDGTGTPESGSDTITGIVSRVFEKIGSLVGELLAMVIRLLDKLLTGFDEIVTSFNEKTEQIVNFGSGYTAWLSGLWVVVPSDLQLALSFCVVVICLGIIGKKVVFAS